MNKATSDFVIIMVALGLALGQSCSSPPSDLPYRISSVKDGEKSGPIRIHFAKDADSLPEALELCGRVVEESLPAQCGTVAWAGTLKLRLLKKVTGYKPEFVYVVVPCLGDMGSTFMDRTVRIRVDKLYIDHKTCYFDLIENKIESEGIPFYCLQSGRGSIEDIKSNC